MKRIEPAQRRVVNIHDRSRYAPFDPAAEPGTSFLKLNPDLPRDVGFYVYRMAPGSSSTPHRHGGAEEFLILEGELIDNDGTVYRTGDMVWLAAGTEHSSTTQTGCLIAVYAEGPETAPG